MYLFYNQLEHNNTSESSSGANNRTKLYNLL